MRRLIFGLTTVIGLSLTWGLTSDVAAQNAGDPVTGYSADDLEMNAAMDAARASLPLFLENATEGGGTSIVGAGIKVAFPTGNDGAEIIWVNPFRWDGGAKFVGLLSNQPNYLGDLNAGDQVAFSIDMVRDWSLSGPSGQMFGNYTTRVMIPQLDQETAVALTQMLSADPVPAGWN